MFTGRTGVPTAQISRIYRNDGGSFVDLNAGLTGFDLNSAVWGDYDNDGDLDLLLTGRDASGGESTRILRNNSLTPNTPPAAPSGLQTTLLPNESVRLSWTGSNDAQTPVAGQNYNLRVGTTPGGSDVFSSMASGATGLRRIPDAGLIQRNSHVLQGLLPNVTYYWSVQAIDTAFAGSSFAGESSFRVNVAPVLGGAASNQAVNDNTTINPFAAFTVFDSDTPAQTLTVQVQLSTTANGAFTAASLSASGFTDQSGGLYRYIGTASQAQAAIRQLALKPIENLVPAGSTTTTSFTVSASDGIASPTLNAATGVVALSVKDSPTISVVPVQTSSPFGYAISSQATISGGFGPTGTVTFRLYNNSAGTGTPIFTDTQALVAGTATSANYTALVPGNLYWVATYNGDSENNSATSAASSPVLIATPIFVGGAYWYLGPGTVGSDLQVNRYVPVKRQSGSMAASERRSVKRRTVRCWCGMRRNWFSLEADRLQGSAALGTYSPV